MLSTNGVTVTFGGVRAVDDVALRVDEGQLVGLIGPNGAGKTTFIDALTGFVPAEGSIELDGRALSALAPHRRARAGLARTWQSVELFDDLTVAENLQVASEHQRLGGTMADLVRPRRTRDRSAVDDALRVLDLADLSSRRPGELSQGQRKLVGVARALAARPKVVCMDEPAAGLDSAESVALGDRLRSMAASGVGVLLVDHDMGLVLGACEFVYVIEFGTVIASGTPGEIRNNERVIAAYLGSSACSN